MQKKGSSTTPQPTTTSSTHQIKGFNPASYVKPGLSQAEVEEMKASFDLFDTDQGGSVDAKGTYDIIQS
jgi:Ca2+-binding EF-hand superfamily protein